MSGTPWAQEDFRVVIGSTAIDFDPNKEDENRAKHGYSLMSAVDIFEKLLLPISSTPICIRDASTQAERRHEHLAVDSDGKVVFIVTTMRDEETIRVISLRRASHEERALFQQATGYAEAQGD